MHHGMWEREKRKEREKESLHSVKVHGGEFGGRGALKSKDPYVSGAIEERARESSVG